MTVVFQTPPQAGALDRTGQKADLEVMRPFFIDSGLGERYGVDRAHIHYKFDLDAEAVCRVDFPDAQTRVTSVVPKAQVRPERAAGWWFRSDGASVSSLYAAEEMYACDWEEDLAKIGAFFAANGLTKYGVRTLQRSFPVGADKLEVEHTNRAARIQIFSVMPLTARNDSAWTGMESVWRFSNQVGSQGETYCETHCEGYCMPGGAAYDVVA